MRAHRLASLAASLIASSAMSGALAVEHYDLAALNDQALESLERGDVMTACILLHRAVRLAPYDARTADNVRVLEAHLAGVPPPASTPAVSPAAPAKASAPAAAPVVPPAPPAPWPPK
jgi:hypothetical protein